MLDKIALFSLLFVLAGNVLYGQTAAAENDNGFQISAQNSEHPNVTVLEEIDPRMSLRFQLHRIHGLSLVGGQLVVTSNRRTPLYVIDGFPIGSFKRASSMVNILDIEKISFLQRGATFPYGPQGRNGVIHIETKMDDTK